MASLLSLSKTHSPEHRRPPNAAKVPLFQRSQHLTEQESAVSVKRRVPDRAHVSGGAEQQDRSELSACCRFQCLFWLWRPLPTPRPPPALPTPDGIQVLLGTAWEHFMPDPTPPEGPTSEVTCIRGQRSKADLRAVGASGPATGSSVVYPNAIVGVPAATGKTLRVIMDPTLHSKAHTAFAPLLCPTVTRPEENKAPTAFRRDPCVLKQSSLSVVSSEYTTQKTAVSH